MMVAVSAMRTIFSGFRVNQPTVRISTAVVIVVMRMLRDHDSAFDMIAHVQNRRPGELERNDEHDDQGDEAAHEWNSTE